MHWILKSILHIFFWCTYFLFAGLISFHLSEGFSYILEYKWIYLINAIWAAVAFYIHYFVLFHFISKRQFWRYLIFSVTTSATVSLIFFSFFKLFYFNINQPIEILRLYPPMIGSYIIGNTGSLVRGFIDWFNESSRKTEIERQRLSIELELLRSQLNHHFLFNTLNNIDTLIFKDQNKASESLIALSSILRYMLYETKADKVPINKEIENIWNIIHLEQLRVTTPKYTRLTVEGETAEILVPPLLFVPFIENAYKHSGFTGKLPVIDIHFQIIERTLRFTCSNYKENQLPENHKPGNIGLQNIERRLMLLYGNACKFNIANEESLFKITVEIPC